MQKTITNEATEYFVRAVSAAVAREIGRAPNEHERRIIGAALGEFTRQLASRGPRSA